MASVQLLDGFKAINYRIMQIVRGGKVSQMHELIQIRWKTFAVRCAHC